MYVLFPRLSQYSRWKFCGIRVGYNESDKSFCWILLIFILLPMSLCWYKGKVNPRTGQGSRCIAVLFLQPRRQMRVVGQRHAPTALPLGKTRYPLYRRLGGPQDRSGRARKISPPPALDPRTPTFLFI